MSARRRGAARVQYEAIVPIVTSFHNVQYLAIVWFFHRNRLGPRLHHYYLDQRIWHVRHDAGLSRDLRLHEAT